MTSEVKKRIGQIGRQLDNVRLRLNVKSERHYVNEGTYKYQQSRANQLIINLEEELSMLSCPGEYAELTVATVADELGLTCKQVRNLIKSGEIEATGSAAHERVCRTEMKRIAALGPHSYFASASRNLTKFLKWLARNYRTEIWKWRTGRIDA